MHQLCWVRVDLHVHARRVSLASYAWQRGRVGSPPRLYKEIGQIMRRVSSQNSLVRLSHEVPFAALLSSLPHPGDCMHNRPGDQTSETPSVEILHRDTGDKVFGERLCAIVKIGCEL